MGQWTATVTNKGYALQAKLLSTDKLTITRVVSGSGSCLVTQLINQTAVTDIKQVLTVDDLSYDGHGNARIRVVLSNIGLETGYNVKQIGIYATDPDEGEILYAITQADEAEEIPSINEQPNGFYCSWDFALTYSNSQNVEVTIDPSNAISQETADNRYLKKSDAYSLPTASATEKGGVKIGEGLNINEDGVLSAEGGGEADSVAWANVTGRPSSFPPSSHNHSASDVSGLAKVSTTGSYNDLKDQPSIPSAYSLPVASASTLGGVKIGSRMSIDDDGVLTAKEASIYANGFMSYEDKRHSEKLKEQFVKEVTLHSGSNDFAVANGSTTLNNFVYTYNSEDKFSVTWDGEDYEALAVDYESYVRIGKFENNAVSWEPFCFIISLDGTASKVQASTAGTHTWELKQTNAYRYAGRNVEGETFYFREWVDGELVETSKVASEGALIFNDSVERYFPLEGATMVIGSAATGKNATTHGTSNEATGNNAFATGCMTQAKGEDSFTTGKFTTAKSECAFCNGMGNTANRLQTVIGRYADTSTTTKGGVSSDTSNTTGSFFVIGNGSSESSLGNAFRVSASGAVYGGASYNSSNADTAYFREWVDGNPDNEDRIGHFVALDGEKIRKATAADDDVYGVVSAFEIASFIANNYSDEWQGRYLKDAFGRKILEEVEIEAYTDEEGVEHPASVEMRPKVNPDYDPTQEYIPREERPEWSVVSLIGEVVIIDDGTCQVNGYVKPNNDGIGTAAEGKTNYRVMKRIDENHVRIFIKLW